MSVAGPLRDTLARILRASETRIDLTLARVERVWERLGAPPVAARIVTVAGTNGKGSCAHFLDRCLRQRGLRVGLYTSPHLLRFAERVRVDGAIVDDEALVDAFARVEAARDDEPLTFFEFTTLAALLHFSASELDIAVLEVGLGGRLDAVNLVSADVAIVTTVALDHQEYLGDTREAIASEKAGVFRSGSPAISADAEPPATLRERALEVGALPLFRGAEFDCVTHASHWDLGSATLRLTGLPIAGSAPVAAFAAAIVALECLQELPETAVLRGLLQDWQLAGRQQFVAGDVSLVLDVAHNPAAGRALASALTRRPVAGRTHIVVGMLADKDAAQFLALLAPLADQWLLVDLPGARGQSAERLRDRLPASERERCIACKAVAGALAVARSRCVKGDRIVVCGSFQVVGPALAWLGLYSASRGPAGHAGSEWNND